MLSYVLWPFVITAGTGATYLGLESGYPLPAVFFAVGAGMLARVLVAEQWIMPFRQLAHADDVERN